MTSPAEVKINEAPTRTIAALPWKATIIHSATKVFALTGFYFLSGGLVREVFGHVNVLVLTAGQVAAVLAARRWATGRWFR